MTDIILLPREGMFLKDGREWASSDAGRAHSLDWPMPSTLHGALCTAVGRKQEEKGTAPQWGKLAADIRIDRLLPLRRRLGLTGNWVATERIWPVPADALFLSEPQDRLRRLEPRKPLHPTLGARADRLADQALWWPRVEEAAKPAPAPRWWNETALLAWLANDAEERAVDAAFRGIKQERRIQVHVGIDPRTQAAKDQILFAHDIVETLDEQRCEWAIGCRVALPNGASLGDRLTLGGDRRAVAVSKQVPPPALFECPDALAQAFGNCRGLRLMAVTPAAFAGGWLPDGFKLEGGEYRGKLKGINQELVLRAACMPRATHVSGWDMAKGEPKATTRLVPPGTVYHFTKRGGVPFAASDAKNLWCAALGARTEQGFGRFVPGVWKPQESPT